MIYYKSLPGIQTCVYTLNDRCEYIEA